MNDEQEVVGEESYIGDLDLIDRTFQIARRGMGATGGNPLVGVVIALLNPSGTYEILAEGYHRGKGTPHAEIDAIRALLDYERLPDEEPERRNFLERCCLYVNLEPCTHEGATPPCTEAIIKAGIGRVCWACDDTHEEASGAAEVLRDAGVAVRENLKPAQARNLNAVHYYVQENDCAFAALKLAASLDGKIATSTGESQWITSKQARGLSHTFRQRFDAVAVGVQTVYADDPRLTVREEELNAHWRGNIPFEPRDPAVVVIDPQLRTPVGAELFNAERRVVLVHADSVEPTPDDWPEQTEFLEFPSEAGEFHWELIKEMLLERNIYSVLVEGGATTSSRLLGQDEADKLYHFTAPLIIGEDGLSPYSIPGAEEMENTISLTFPQVEALEDEALLSGYLNFDPEAGPESTAESSQHDITGMSDQFGAPGQ